MQTTGKTQAYIVAAIIIGVSLLTQFQKTWFVEPTGHISVFGNVGALLAIGLIFRWKYIREILSVMMIMAIIGCISSIYMSNFNSISMFVLLAAFSVSFYFLAISNNLKTYVGNR